MQSDKWNLEMLSDFATFKETRVQMDQSDSRALVVLSFNCWIQRRNQSSNRRVIELHKIFSTVQEESAVNSEKTKIYNYLPPKLHMCFKDEENVYETCHLPHKDHPETAQIVTYQIDLSQIVDYDSIGKLTLVFDIHLLWIDENRKWNAKALGINSIRVPIDEIWSPELELFDCISGACGLAPNWDELALIHSDGYVYLHVNNLFKLIAIWTLIISHLTNKIVLCFHRSEVLCKGVNF